MVSTTNSKLTLQCLLNSYVMKSSLVSENIAINHWNQLCAINLNIYTQQLNLYMQPAWGCLWKMCISHLQPRSIYIFASAKTCIYYAPTMMFRRIVSVNILKVNNIKEHFFRMIHGIRSINYGPDRPKYRITQVAWCNLSQLV